MMVHAQTEEPIMLVTAAHSLEAVRLGRLKEMT